MENVPPETPNPNAPPVSQAPVPAKKSSRREKALVVIAVVILIAVAALIIHLGY